LTSEPINLISTDDDREITGSQESGVLHDEGPTPKNLCQRMLEGILRILQEDGHIQTGLWALLLSESDDAGDDLAVDLSIPILDLGTGTLHKIQRLLRQDGFAKHGILVLKMDSVGADGYDKRWIEDIRARY